MSSEETIIQIRKDKHQELNGGIYPLATDQVVCSIAFFLTDIDNMIMENEIRTTIDLAEAKGNGSRTLHGRLTALRKSGALTFIKLTDATGNIQLVATRNNLPDYGKMRLLDLGDIVEVTGEPVLTKTGERSLLLSEWQVLTKAHRPPPEKFHGIADDELKARKRYLDLMSSEETRARFVMRSIIIKSIREFMDKQGFMEVETSTMSSIASGANAKPFTTHHNALDIDLCLRIAPELNLKRLLVGGFDKVFEIGRNYRNEGIDTRHNPEFTMMESYQAYGKFPELITFTKNLFRHVVLADYYPTAWVRKYLINWRREMPFTLTEFAEVTMEQAVQNALDKLQMRAYLDQPVYGEWYQFTPPEYTSETGLQRQAKIDFVGLLSGLNKSGTRGERLAVFFEYLAEPFLTEDYRSVEMRKSLPVFITEYPKDISPLARSNDSNPKICDRFELFIDGKEIANAFQELNDPDEQARRFQEQLETNNKDPMDYDADYIEALEYGMPPAIGFGIGIDRLCCLLTGTSSIKDVILFPTLRPIK